MGFNFDPDMKWRGMMLSIFIAGCSCYCQTIEFRIGFSKPFAVFQFLNRLTPGAGSNVYKRLYNKSSFANKKNNALISRFDSLYIGYSYEFDDYPPGQKVGIDVPNLLRRNLILSANVEEFKLRSMGLVPNDQLLRLVDLINDFTPIYESVIYGPSKDKFDQQLRGIRDLVDSTNITHYFTQAMHFYDASWDFQIPFVFSFYPLPESKGFTATAVSNVGISAVADSLDTYITLLSVMLHEVCHVLYDERSLSTWKKSDVWFTSSPSKVSRYAYSLFNEAMASAVGNGYLGAVLVGKEDTARRLYGVSYINQAAKMAYPLVKEYMLNNRSIDSEFVARYIQLFETQQGDWLSNPRFLFWNQTLLSDRASDFKTMDSMYGRSPYHNYITGISSSALERLVNNHGTRVIIVNEDNRKKLALIQSNFPELKGWKYKASKDFSYLVFMDDKTWLLIFNNVSERTEAKLKAIKFQIRDK